MIKIELNGKLVEASKHQLLALALRGRIGRQTRIVLDGKESTAGKIKGIVFGGENTVESIPQNKREPIYGTALSSMPETVIPPPNKSEVYGLAIPPSPPITGPNPFTATVHVEDNPFTVAVPVEKNPFIAPQPSPIPAVRTVHVVPPINQVSRQDIPTDDSIVKKRKIPLWFIVVGVMALLIVVGGVNWTFFAGGGQYTVSERLEIVSFRMKYGNDVNSRDKDGGTLLHKAADQWGVAVIKYLISKGADVDAKDNRGCTPLINLAIRNCLVTNRPDLTAKIHGGTVDVAACLIDHGADIDAKDNEGKTAIHWAVISEENVEFIQLLYSERAHINWEDNEGKTPLDLAKLFIKPKIIAFLSNPSVVEYHRSTEITMDKFQFTPAEKAEYDRFCEDITESGNEGAIVIVNGNDVVGILAVAAGYGNTKVVRILVSKGADVNANAKDCATPLMCAAEGGHLEVAKYLVSKGAYVNAKNQFYTPLMSAAREGNLEVIKFLISKGADVNAKTKGGTLFISKGADVKAKTTGGTLFMEAARGGHLEVVKYLVSKGADVNANAKDCATPLMCAAEGGHLEVIKYLISKGADVNAKTEGGDTPLLEAARGGNLEVIKYLISKGADVNAETKNSGLRLAASGGHLEVVKYLVSEGADVNAKKSWSGNTPLHEVSQNFFWGRQNERIAVAKMLVENGGDVNIKNNSGETPLDLAKEDKNKELAIYLESVSSRAGRK